MTEKRVNLHRKRYIRITSHPIIPRSYIIGIAFSYALLLLSSCVAPLQLPSKHEVPHQEKLPIDGTWELQFQSSAGAVFKIEAGRMYIWANYSSRAWHGMVVAKNIRQISPLKYGCEYAFVDKDSGKAGFGRGESEVMSEESLLVRYFPKSETGHEEMRTDTYLKMRLDNRAWFLSQLKPEVSQPPKAKSIKTTVFGIEPSKPNIVIYKVIGSFDSYNEVFVGTITTTLNGTAYIEIQGQISGTTCSGRSYVIENYRNCKGDKSKARLNCDDGRIINANSESITCGHGFAEGYDQQGNRLSFSYGMKGYEAKVVLERELQDAAKKPDLPPVGNRTVERPQPKEAEKPDVEETPQVAKKFLLGSAWPDSSGYVVTNYHLVHEHESILLIRQDGTMIPANVVVRDEANDLVLLKPADVDQLPPALPLSSIIIGMGAKVFTIGYPHPDIMGAKPKLAAGVVSAIFGVRDDPRYLQISVPLHPGNSGGPLLNMNGEVVGVVTSKLSAIRMLQLTGDIPQNVSYAVKIPYVKALLGSVSKLKNHKVLQARTGTLEELAAVIKNSVLMVVVE